MPPPDRDGADPLRLFVDCRVVRWPTHDGISRYTAELVTALARLTPLTMLIHDERQLALLPDLPWVRIPSQTSALDPVIARFINPLRPDVVFSPMQTMGSLGRRYRLVLTVHDLIYYTHRTPPREFNAFIRGLWRLYHLTWWPQRWLLARADAVAVVSETTRDLVLRKRLTGRPIILAPNASSLTVGASPRTAPASRDLVYMGSFMPYKNVESLVLAMNALPGYRLRLLSRIDPAGQARLEALSTAGNLDFLHGVTDEEYVEALSSATALVTASLDEGFGIPIVEAMGLGIPVVVSDIPIFHEIAGDAAVYVDPRDVPDIVRGIRSLEDADAWRDRSTRSIPQAAVWNWDRSARQLLDGILALPPR
jgi:glycosyltransferase involved in cell wall biosynthesis